MATLVVDPAAVGVDGDTAKVPFTSDDGPFGVDLVREGGAWKADGLFPVSDEVADGVPTVDLTLDEFSFTFDDSKVADGNFAFAVTNNGEQTHEVVVLGIPEDADLQALLQEDEPEGVTDVAFKFPFGPADEADMAVPQLDPGRYALVCFLPDTDDPEGTPHAVQGMTAEFTVE